MNEMYSYIDEMMDDVREYIESEYEKGSDLRRTAPTRDELEWAMQDALWDYDGVTGNGSGSYTFNRWQAAQCVVEDGTRWLEEAKDEGFITAEEIG